MGVRLDDIKELIEFVRINLGNHLNEMILIELGEQELKIFNEEKNSGLLMEYLNSDPRPYNKNLIKNNTRIGLYCKDYLEIHFKEILSICHEGKCPKTLKSKLFDEIKLNNKYDILTNFEYTKDLGKNDDINDNILYKSFKNIHNSVKKGGLIFNILPCISKQNTVINSTILYSSQFFDELAKLCGYRIFYNNEIMRNSKDNNINFYVHCHYIKNNNNEFISEYDFMKIKSLIRITDKMKQKPRKYFNSYSVK